LFDDPHTRIVSSSRLLKYDTILDKLGMFKVTDEFELLTACVKVADFLVGLCNTSSVTFASLMKVYGYRVNVVLDGVMYILIQRQNTILFENKKPQQIAGALSMEN